jgi:Dolichyl-phosphate-mannose-protein mannosyltransferase
VRSIWRHAAAHPLTTIFGLALLVRLINVACLAGNEAFFAESDTYAYWALGDALAKPGGFWPALWSMTDRMPLYPLLLASVQRAFGDAPRVVALIQAVIDAGTCTAIAALGAMISPRAGWLAGILAAFCLTLVVMSSQILTDTLFLFFFTLMLLAGAHFLRRPAAATALLAGLAGGLALATRPAVAVLLAAAVPLVFAIALLQRRAVMPALVAAVVFTVAAAAPIAPMWLRNVIQYGSFGLTTQSGDHLAFWIVPLVAQRADGTPYQATVDRMEARYQQVVAERGLSAETNPFRLAAMKSEIAREEMARLPLAACAKAWLEGMVVNLGAPALLVDPRVRALPRPSFYNTPGASLWEKGRGYVLDDPGRYQVLLVLGVIAMLPFLVLEAVGFVMLARRLPWAAVLAAGVLVYFLMLNGPVATPKYRLPMEPVLIVLAAIPVARLAERITSSK